MCTSATAAKTREAPITPRDRVGETQATLHDDIQDAFRDDDEEPEEAHIESHEPKPLETGTYDPGKPEAGKHDPGMSDSAKPDPGKPTEPPPADTTA